MQLLSLSYVDSLSNNNILCFDADRIRSWFPVETAKDKLKAKPYQQQYLAKACSGR